MFFFSTAVFTLSFSFWGGGGAPFFSCASLLLCERSWKACEYNVVLS